MSNFMLWKKDRLPFQGRTILKNFLEFSHENCSSPHQNFSKPIKMIKFLKFQHFFHILNIYMKIVFIATEIFKTFQMLKLLKSRNFFSFFTFFCVYLQGSNHQSHWSIDHRSVAGNNFIDTGQLC